MSRFPTWSLMIQGSGGTLSSRASTLGTCTIMPAMGVPVRLLAKSFAAKTNHVQTKGGLANTICGSHSEYEMGPLHIQLDQLLIEQKAKLALALVLYFISKAGGSW